MGKCTIDHSLEDVKAKLESQAPFLPKEISEKLERFLNEQLDQHTLNEIFHLLKKYDLADAEEQRARDEQIKAFVEK
jgi:uncharacterized secreted protein with C-terminal beta-propeller domain